MSASYDDPFHRLQRDVERMFRTLIYHRHGGGHFGEPVWSPATDVVMSDRSVHVTVELAGVPRDRVRVQIQGRTLEISGRRNPTTPEPGNRYYSAEIWYGEFRRAIELPWNADHERIDAHYRDGMLEIHLVPATVEMTRVSVEYPGS